MGEIKEGVRVLVAEWVNTQRARPVGEVVSTRKVRDKTAFVVRHDCGKLRTWYSEQLHVAVR